jgi:hypothetical protein
MIAHDHQICSAAERAAGGSSLPAASCAGCVIAADVTSAITTSPSPNDEQRPTDLCPRDDREEHAFGSVRCE